MDFVYASFRLAVSSVTPVKKFGVSVIFDGAGLKLDLIKANLGNLRVGVGATWQDDVLLGELPLEKSISCDVSCMDIRVVSKLWSR